MSILGRLLGGGGPLVRRDRDVWAGATTLDDLAELTARWLEGDIESHPGYYGPCDVDEADGLREVLIDLNRCGFLTRGSQEGFDGVGYDGAHWEQVAAVAGFGDEATFDWLTRSLNGTRFDVFAYPCQSSRWGRGLDGVAVTWRDGRPVTEFGAQVGAHDIADLDFAGCGEAAVDAVCRALQITVYDPEVGSNDLWAALAWAAVRHR